MQRRKFTREFKLGAVRLVNEQGRTIMQAAESLGVDPKSVRQWVAAFSADPASASPAALAAELQRLRKEVARLQVERDILKKAAAFFAREPA